MIDLFPNPAFENEVLRVVLLAGYYSVMERSARRSELRARRLIIQNKATWPISVSVEYLNRQQIEVGPGEGGTVTIEYAYNLDRIGGGGATLSSRPQLGRIDVTPVPNMGDDSEIFQFQFDIDVYEGEVETKCV